jgi:hypothetical protein
LSEKAQDFFISAANTLNYMGTTGIFLEAPYAELKSLPADIMKFGFSTCFCFQWTLFENFVKQQVLYLANRNLLVPTVSKGLKKRERHTEAFLKYIDSGQVFGASPFKTVLPARGWVPGIENCDFKDLDEIRRQRNELIHAEEGTPMRLDANERNYERSMWLLRQFAGNIDQSAAGILQISSGT